MTYEELKREISERSITQLPGLVQHIIRTCSIKPVFVDKEAVLRFVGKAWDMGGWMVDLPNESAPYEPKGTKFYSAARQQEMILVSEDSDQWAGWLCYRHPDGQWVSLRKATEADYAELANAISNAHHTK